MHKATRYLALAFPLLVSAAAVAQTGGTSTTGKDGGAATTTSSAKPATQRLCRDDGGRLERTVGDDGFDDGSDGQRGRDGRRDVQRPPPRSRSARRRAEGPDPPQPHAPRAPQRHDPLAAAPRARAPRSSSRTRCRARSASRARSSSSTARSSTTAQDDTGALADQKEIPIFSGSIPPGDHTVQVVLNFQGNGYGVFTYLRGYKFEVKSAPLVHGGRGQDAHAHRDRAREGRRHDAARAAPDDRVGREGRRARRRRQRAAPRRRRRRAAKTQRHASPGVGRRAASRSGEGSSLGRVASARRRSARRSRWRSRARGARDAHALALAADGDADANGADRGHRRRSRERAASRRRSRRRRRERYTVEQRLTNGELLYRTKDYAARGRRLQRDPRGVPRHAVATPTRSGSAARRSTRRRSTSRRAATTARSSIAEHEPRFHPYFGKALARLVDVSLRINDIKRRSTRSSRSSTRCRPRRSTPRCSTPRARRYYFKRRLRERARRAPVGPERQRRTRTRPATSRASSR